MVTRKKGKDTVTTTSRQRTLLQRISSSFTSLLSLAPRRESGATTAPVLQSQEQFQNRPQASRTRSHLIPQISIPKLSETAQTQPHESSRSHFLPSIEIPQCNTCGLKADSRRHSNMSNAGKSCRNCRSRSQFSHISFSYRPSRASAPGVSRANESIPLLGQESPKAENTRSVSAATATERVGNPARTVSFPSGRTPSHRNLLQLPSSRHERITNRPSSQESFDIQSISVRHNTRPVSPSLHHIHGLARSKEFPYVHKHEVETHMVTLRAGSPNPLRDRGGEARRTAATPETFVDYSRTVYYTRSATPSGSGSTSTRPGKCSQGTQSSSTRNPYRTSPFQEELASSNVYRRRSPQPFTPRITDLDIDEEDDSFSTLTTQTPSTVGGRRLELKGGSSVMPRLRGGAGSDRFSFKKWLLTCRGLAYDTDSSNDETLPTRDTMSGCYVRSYHRPRGIISMFPEPKQDLTSRAILERAYQPISDIHWTPTSPMDNKAINEQLKSSNMNNPTTASPPTSAKEDSPSSNPSSQSRPHLPGGTDSPSTFDTLSLPPTLYWFAGGKSSPIKISSWKSQRGKSRMGGFWGMAVHGSKAGTNWEVKVETASDVNVDIKVEVNGEKVLEEKLGEEGMGGGMNGNRGGKEGSTKNSETEKKSSVGGKNGGVEGSLTSREPNTVAEHSVKETDLNKLSISEADALADQDPFPEAVSGPGEVRDV